MSEEERVDVTTSHPDIAARFLAGVREAQRWGGGFGEPSPAGTSVNAESGELEHVEKPLPEEPEAPAGGAEPSSEEEAEAAATTEPEEEKPDPEDAVLERVQQYIARLRRARSTT